MAMRVAAAAVVSAVLMFLWGFVYWVLLGSIERLSDPLPAELDVLAVLRRENTPSGMYVYPGPPVMADAKEMPDEAAKTEVERKMKEGPLLRMAYRAEGKEGVMEPMDFVKALAHYLLVALLLALLAAWAAPALPTYGSRVAFVTLAAVAGAAYTNLGDVVWWHHPLDWALGNMAYEIAAGLLAALVIGAVVKRPTAAA